MGVVIKESSRPSQLHESVSWVFHAEHKYPCYFMVAIMIYGIVHMLCAIIIACHFVSSMIQTCYHET